jgi:hypothetical protein
LIKKETIMVGLVAAFIVLPAALSLSAYFITKNPNLRPLGVTIEKLAEAGLIKDSGEIIAVISIGDKSGKHASKNEYSNALETAFERFNSKVRIKFRTVPNNSHITVTYLVGMNRIGPYEINNAAGGIKAAVRAERMLKSHQLALAKKLENSNDAHNKAPWFRFFDG